MAGQLIGLFSTNENYSLECEFTYNQAFRRVPLYIDRAMYSISVDVWG